VIKALRPAMTSLQELLQPLQQLSEDEFYELDPVAQFDSAIRARAWRSDARSAVNRAESTPRPRLKRERLSCDQRYESIGTSGELGFP
jgi:hypothetical protein